MTLQAMLDEVMKLEIEVTEAPAGDPGLDAIARRIGDLQRELDAMRGGHEPLVPDASRPPGHEEKSEANLASALRSLLSASQAKRGSGA